MDPRSLVGMSERRKKQLSHAEREALAAGSHPHSAAWFSEWQAARKTKWRIGERVRPCAYCLGPEWIESMRCPAVAPGWMIRPEVQPCDGSGLVPARRARRA